MYICSCRLCILLVENVPLVHAHPPHAFPIKPTLPLGPPPFKIEFKRTEGARRGWMNE
jgi:hypothetical protein